MKHLKVAVVGDTMVGKSWILLTYQEKIGETKNKRYFYPDYDSCIEVDINVGDNEYIVEISDTTGKEEYEKLRPFFYQYHKTDCFIICYSIESRESFDNVISKWYPEVHKYARHAPIVLVGTKSDLREPNAEKYVTTEEANELKTKIGAYEAMECSAKNQENLKEIFIEAVRAC